jgi:hypothetical protein
MELATFVVLSIVLVTLTVCLSEYSRRTRPVIVNKDWDQFLAEEEAWFAAAAQVEADRRAYRELHNTSYISR